MLLQVDDVHVHYGNVHAVKGVSLEVGEGEIVTLVGANGAGKTTLMRAVSGVRTLTGGAVRFAGEDLADVPAHAIVRRGLCQSPEGRGVFPGMTVLENLEIGAYGRPRGQRATLGEDLDRVYGLFPVLKERRRQAGGTLSGGEQQMLAIGRALMARPKLLMLDEPSMGLAPKKVQQIFQIITTIREQGTTVLLVEQNAAQALRRADRAYVLEHGTVVRQGAAADLLADDALRSAYLGGDVTNA